MATGLNKNRGSILILVLWMLMMVEFLAVQYVAHNRTKAGFAANAWQSLQHQQDVESVLQLFSVDGLPFAATSTSRIPWTEFLMGDTVLHVKVEQEGARTELNKATDDVITAKLRSLFGLEYEEEADRLADAILDWRDPDNLVRTSGAEERYYRDEKLPYKPANGPFKRMTELMLVRGMTADYFWGDPWESMEMEKERFEIEQERLERGVSRRKEETDESESLSSFFETFTIHPKDVKRVSILIPGPGNGYVFVLAFLGKGRTGWSVHEIDRVALVKSTGHSTMDESSSSFRKKEIRKRTEREDGKMIPTTLRAVGLEKLSK